MPSVIETERQAKALAKAEGLTYFTEARQEKLLRFLEANPRKHFRAIAADPIIGVWLSRSQLEIHLKRLVALGSVAVEPVGRRVVYSIIGARRDIRPDLAAQAGEINSRMEAAMGAEGLAFQRRVNEFDAAKSRLFWQLQRAPDWKRKRCLDSFSEPELRHFIFSLRQELAISDWTRTEDEIRGIRGDEANPSRGLAIGWLRMLAKHLGVHSSVTGGLIGPWADGVREAMPRPRGMPRQTRATFAPYEEVVLRIHELNARFQ